MKGAAIEKSYSYVHGLLFAPNLARKMTIACTIASASCGGVYTRHSGGGSDGRRHEHRTRREPRRAASSGAEVRSELTTWNSGLFRAHCTSRGYSHSNPGPALLIKVILV